MPQPTDTPRPGDQVGPRSHDHPEAVDRGPGPAKVLAGVADPAARQDAEQTPPGRGCAADVHALDRRRVHDGMVGVPDPSAEIDVLAVEEEALVEAPDLGENIAPDEQARARRPIARVPPVRTEPGRESPRPPRQPRGRRGGGTRACPKIDRTCGKPSQ